MHKFTLILTVLNSIKLRIISLYGGWLSKCHQEIKIQIFALDCSIIPGHRFPTTVGVFKPCLVITFPWCHTHAHDITGIFIYYFSYQQSLWHIYLLHLMFKINIYIIMNGVATYRLHTDWKWNNIYLIKVDISANIILLLHLWQLKEFHWKGKTKLLSSCYSCFGRSSGTVIWGRKVYWKSTVILGWKYLS